MKKLPVKVGQHVYTCLLTAALSCCFLVSHVKATVIHPPKADSVSIEGRWDITIDMAGKKTPSWLEVRHSGTHTLVGFFVGPGGSARPISVVNYNGSKLSFSIPPQWERGNRNLTVEGTVSGDKLTGTMNTVEDKNYTWTAVRAPLLKRAKEPTWGSPVKLFDGTSLKGWHASGATNQWVAEGGVLKSPKAGSNLVTDKTFDDFKLHIEFRYPKESNSGVYLRGRYEIQITDSKGMEPSVDQLGAIYGFLPPSDMMAKGAGEWQSYDVKLVGRMVTLAVNGKTVITNQQIPGITGGAIDSNEGEPGPLLIQGDHLPIEYRNIVITLPK
jgi:hypothetical protein